MGGGKPPPGGICGGNPGGIPPGLYPGGIPPGLPPPIGVKLAYTEKGIHKINNIRAYFIHSNTNKNHYLFLNNVRKKKFYIVT